MSSPDRSSATYTPLLALPWWDTVGPFLTPLVEGAAEHLNLDPRVLYPVVTPFVLWCWQDRGLDLEPGQVFRQSVIEQFVATGMPEYARGSRNTFRGRLLRVANVVGTASQRELRPIGRSAPTTPYSTADIARLWSWSTSQNTPARQTDARVLLALGLGCGLAAREVLNLRVRDISSDGALVTVPSGRQRTVSVDGLWRAPLADRVVAAGRDEWAFRRRRNSVDVGQITDFVQRHRTAEDIRVVRMRATWLAGRIRAGQPTTDLLREAGLTQFAALDRYRSSP